MLQRKTGVGNTRVQRQRPASLLVGSRVRMCAGPQSSAQSASLPACSGNIDRWMVLSQQTPNRPDCATSGRSAPALMLQIVSRKPSNVQSCSAAASHLTSALWLQLAARRQNADWFGYFAPVPVRRIWGSGLSSPDHRSQPRPRVAQAGRGWPKRVPSQARAEFGRGRRKAGPRETLGPTQGGEDR